MKRSKNKKSCACTVTIIKYVAGGVVGVVLLVFLIAATMVSNTFDVQESLVIEKPAGQIYPLVENLRAWDRWSPFAEMAREAETNYSGPEAGAGAKVAWKGKRAGEGSLQIINSDPYRLIQFEQQMVKPTAGNNDFTFQFVGETEQSTRVTWRMYGTHNGLMSKVLWLVWCRHMMNSMMGEGLENLKATVQG